MRAHDVTTVLGPDPLVRPGIVDAHAHLWISPPAGATPGGPMLDDETAITAELTDFAARGGVAAIDCQPPGTGRDARRLVALARATKVAIVACTGFHLPRYYDPARSPWDADPDRLRHRLQAELHDGLEDGAGGRLAARAGAVKAAHPGRLDGRTRAMLEAAAGAATDAGVLLAIHTERGQGVEELAELLFDLPMRTRDVILCHTDKRPDQALHRALAEDGFLLEYDTFMRAKYDPARRLWPLLDAMLGDGLHDAVAVGSDLADRSQWRFGGDPLGMSAWTESIVPAMRERGLAEDVIAALCGGNVRERLCTSGAAVRA